MINVTQVLFFTQVISTKTSYCDLWLNLELDKLRIKHTNFMAV